MDGLRFPAWFRIPVLAGVVQSRLKGDLDPWHVSRLHSKDREAPALPTLVKLEYFSLLVTRILNA